MEPLGADDPRVIGAYRLLGRLGAGGMGRVYLGRSAGGRTVAVKSVHARLAADDRFRARFRREVESARRVGGAWTAPVLDADPDAPVPWVATGYVAGPSLARAVEDFGPLDASAVRTLGAGLAAALAAVHTHGLVHRDVKPSNVMLTLDGPLLIDFGIARAMDGGAALTATGVQVGSPGYMAPEQILGRDVTGACDVFSLGAVLAYAATGAGPFTGDSSAALLYKVVHEDPDLGAALTGELREVTAACLAKRPGDRPAPGEIVRRLGGAPERGTGWLPAPLVERVSRQAVELLNLDGRVAPSAGVSSGVGVGPDEPAGHVAGAFGPPDPSYGSGLVPFDAVADVPAATSADARIGHPSGGIPTPPPKPLGPPWPPGSPASPSSKERRLTFNGVLGGGAGSSGRRRLSCTLVLSVAGVLAAATTAAFVFQLLPGQGGDGGRDAAAKPPGSGRSPAPGDTRPDASAVPEPFLGTWTGTVITRHNLPNGTITSTITPGAKGDYVVRTTYDFLIARCEAKAELVSATATAMTLRERTDGKPGPGCTGAEAAVTYTLGKDGTLAFASDDEAGGRPHAFLKKKGG
ncbi:serine/threonine-protein kinase [Streptomyces rimosus]|uniref:serine/threonine-protein kinase n=1 Tax=Streptomyces rimosus TaxID=1927 RepID=UPI000518A814|nr:serine/threonine-protein kinase [Streptomyces rimosus]